MLVHVQSVRIFLAIPAKPVPLGVKNAQPMPALRVFQDGTYRTAHAFLALPIAAPVSLQQTAFNAPSTTPYSTATASTTESATRWWPQQQE
jgi:hypothetical protein